MRRKLLKTAALALAAALIASACARDSEQNTFTGDTSEEPEYQDSLNPIIPSAYRDVRGLKLEEGTYISIIGKSEATAFWKAVKSGVMQAAEDLNQELGYSRNHKIKVTYNGPAKSEDIDEQVNILDEELSRYPDVIGIASIDEDACTVQFDLSTENGIPIIALDSGNKYPGIQCTVKTDNQEAARTGAYKLADEIGGKGDVMLLVHDSKSETAKERAKSFQDEIAENYPDVRVAETVYCDQLDDLKKQMAEEQNKGLKEGERKVEKESFSDVDAVQFLIEQHSGLRGIFGTNDSTTMLGLHAIRQAEEEGAGSVEEENRGDDGQKSEESIEGGQKDNQIDDQEPENDDSEKEVPASADGKQYNETVRAGDEKNEEDSKTDGADSGRSAENESGGGASAENASDDGKSAENASGGEDGAADNPTSVNEGTEYTEIVLMGFDVSKEQRKALEEGEISGLVVQNPFGIGYASVVAAARTVLQAGNEAQVSTGYLWVTKENLNEESIQKMLYE